LVVASGNPGKIREFRELLAGLPFEVMSQGELGIEGAAETGATFLDNALLKARHAARCSGCAALADDSGLEVDALGGAPGVHSARYAGEPADDAANNAKLVAALAGVPLAARTARYRCVLVLVERAEDPLPRIADATWEGLIIDAPRGAGGFGYDAHFWLPQAQLTAAQLSPAEKNRLSHRGAALHALRRQLE
jgi:XTP/dITP diphosphohydrolase